MVLVELVASESEEDVRFPHAGRPDQDYLEHVVVLWLTHSPTLYYFIL